MIKTHKTRKQKKTHKIRKQKKNNKKIKEIKKKTKKMKGSGARISALKGLAADTGRSALKSILTMENPIVYAYQLIERNVFGWDTVDQEIKMGETQKKIFGNSLQKKNKDFTMKELIKGEKALAPSPPKLL
jgi:hypothetical protein